MTVLALDVGDRRIGLAISDPTGMLASPLGVVERGPSDLDDVLRVALDNDATEVVVGLPLTLAGESRAQAGKVRSFVQELRSKTDLPVTTWSMSGCPQSRLSGCSESRAVAAGVGTEAGSTRQRRRLFSRRTWTRGGRAGEDVGLAYRNRVSHRQTLLVGSAHLQ